MAAPDFRAEHHQAFTTDPWTLSQLPTGWQDGDYCLLLILADSAATLSSVTGWTALHGATDNQGTQDVRGWLYGRKLRTGDSPPTIDWTAAVTGIATLVAYSGTDPDNPVHTSAANGYVSGASFTTSSITTTVDDCRIVLLAGADESGTFTPYYTFTSMTERVDFESAAFVEAGVGDRVRAAAGAGTEAFTIADSDGTVSFVVALKPAEIPVTSGLRLWLKADDMGTFADNDLVATWPDRSAAAASLTAASGQQPTYQTNELNGLPIVQFDGNDYFTGPNWSTLVGSTFTQPYTILAVVKATSASSAANTYDNDAVLGGAGGNAGMHLKDVSGALVCRAYVWDAAEKVADVAGTFSTWMTLTQERSSTEIKIRRDGGTATTTAAGATSTDTTLRVGTSFTTTNGLNGDVAEIIVYNRVLTTQERTDVEAYLDTKWIASGTPVSQALRQPFTVAAPVSTRLRQPFTVAGPISQRLRQPFAVAAPGSGGSGTFGTGTFGAGTFGEPIATTGFPVYIGEAHAAETGSPPSPTCPTPTALTAQQVTDGAVLIAVVDNDLAGAAEPTITGGSGTWSSLDAGGWSGTDLQAYLYMKPAVAGDAVGGNSYTFSFATGAGAAVTILAFRADPALDTAAKTATSPAGTTHNTPTSDASISGNTLAFGGAIVDAGATDNWTTNAPGTATEIFDIPQQASGTRWQNMVGATNEQVNVGSTTQFTFGYPNSQDAATFVIVLKGLAGGTPTSARLRQPHAVRTSVTARLRQPYAVAVPVSGVLRQPHQIRADRSALLRQPHQVRANRTALLRQPHTIRATVSTALRQPHGVRNARTEILRQRFGVLAARTGILRQPHVVLVALTGRARQPYTVRTAVTGRLRQPHAVQGPVSALLRQPHAVRSSLTGRLRQSFTLFAVRSALARQPYVVRVPISAQLRQSHGVRVFRTGQLRQPHGVRNARTGILRSPFAVRVEISARARQPHVVRAPVSGRVRQPYAAQGSVTGRLRQPHGIRNPRTGSLQQPYGVEQFGVVAGGLRQPFGVRVAVSARLRQPATVRASAEARLRQPHQIRAVRASALRQPYVVVGQVVTRLRQPHAIRAVVSVRMRQPHAVRVAVSARLRQPYAARVIVSERVRQPHGIRQARTAQLHQAYTVRVPVSGFIRQRYIVIGRVETRLRQPYVVRQRNTIPGAVGRTGRISVTHSGRVRTGLTGMIRATIEGNLE